jgi:mannosyltransferase OCH1-like enzyme
MIPKIIHQVWEETTDPLPDFFSQLSETWKEHHPDWQYEFWDRIRMEDFVKQHFTDFSETYFNYRYSVQRWDAIRYLILYKIGGMYVDFDYECLEPFDRYLTGKDICYFSVEPDLHSRNFAKDLYFNNALMITPPGHQFFEHVISHLQTTTFGYTDSKYLDVLASTGPLMLTGMYEDFEDKTAVDFFSSELVSPWSKADVLDFINGTADKEILGQKLEKADAIHYFWGSWLKNDK